jgi:hypothetical protein
LTVKECNDLIAEYNKVTGYVYKPKTKEAKPAKKEAAKSVSKGANTQPATKGINNKTDLLQGQIEALKEMRKEGLLTPAELVECLKGLQV